MRPSHQLIHLRLLGGRHCLRRPDDGDRCQHVTGVAVGPVGGCPCSRTRFTREVGIAMLLVPTRTPARTATSASCRLFWSSRQLRGKSYSLMCSPVSGSVTMILLRPKSATARTRSCLYRGGSCTLCDFPPCGNQIRPFDSWYRPVDWLVVGRFFLMTRPAAAQSRSP